MNRLSVFATVAIVAAALCACGGGGGGSSPTPPSTPTASPSAAASHAASAAPTTSPSPGAASPSPSPSASASAAVGTQSYTGTVVSTDSGNAPVAGATVRVGTAWTYQSTGYAISNVLATATTNASGAFTIAVPPSATVIEVDAAGLVSAHRPIYTNPNSWGVEPPTNSFGTIGLPTESAGDAQELNAVNADRQSLGSGNGTLALSLDADLELTARAVTNNEAANGYYGHTQPGTNYEWGGHYICTSLVGAYCANPIYIDESLGSGPTITPIQCEQGNIVLGPSDGHYQLVISTTNLFIGFGLTNNGLPPSGASVSSEDYCSQEFFTTSDNPSP